MSLVSIRNHVRQHPHGQKITDEKMNPTRLFLFTALALILGLSACSTTREGTLRLYQRNSGDIINLRVGETMEVVLDGNPGTEIHWLKVPGSPELLERVGSTEYKPDLESNTAEHKLFTQFRATAPGRTRLKLSYRDPSEGGLRTRARTTPDHAFEIWVVVKEG